MLDKNDAIIGLIHDRLHNNFSGTFSVNNRDVLFGVQSAFTRDALSRK